MSERLRRLTPADLDQDQQAVYDGIAGGDRAKGVQHFPLTQSDGSLNGPFGIMLHAPGVGVALQELGATIRYRTSMTARVREIAILQVAKAMASRFEWWAHERVGRAVGLTDEELMSLSLGVFRSDDPVEAAAAQFCAQLLGSGHLSDDEYDAVASALGEQQLIELTTLVGYYRTLAQLMTVFAVDVPEEEQEPLPEHRHAH